MEVRKLKLGILLLVVGIGLLVISVPYTISGVINGIFQSKGSIGGFSTYAGIFGAVAGILMIGIGVSKVFKQ
jgi:hypothetical protein